MATTYCGDNISLPTGLSGELAVIEKYQALMAETVAEGSLYMRTKETFFELFEDLELASEEKAKIVAQNIAQMATSLSATSMQSAVVWAKEERDGEYNMAILHGQAMKAQAEVLLAKAQICKLEKETEIECAKKEVLIAGSLRDNGRVSTYDPSDVCRPTALMEEGLKWHQTEMVKAQRYGILSDAFMKNGSVTVDGNGLPVSADGSGKIAEEITFSKRQRVSFEDSKRNHAANAASQMISGLLASEVYSAEHQTLVDKWVVAMDYLNSDSPCPTLGNDCN